MQHATDIVTGLILTLFDLIVAGIAAIEGALRHVLIQIGISHEGQTLVLLALALVLIVAAIRVFGGIFAVLICVVLVLLMLDVLFPGLGTHG